MKVLILGGGGQVGLELLRHPWPAGTHLSAPTREAVDLSNENAIEAIIAEADWRVVINAAAFTAVDQAETSVTGAWRLNALGPAMLAAATAQRGIPLLHVSTDYVFNGAADRPYVENDPVAPINVYGASKEGGEQAVRTANSRHAIIRTAWVISAHRSNFVKTMLRLAQERDEVRVVNDQRGCPTAAKHLASALATIAQRLARDPDAPAGTFHAVNAGTATWCDLAREIMAQAAARGARPAPVIPITTGAFPTPAQRPANSMLSTAKLNAAFGITMPHWTDGLADILDELIGPSTRKKS